jgi:hypothetical protein
MQHAPIASAFEQPALLPLAERFWTMPLVRDASALRDQFLYGKAVNLAPQGNDLYPMDAQGDSLSFSFQTSEAELAFIRSQTIQLVEPLPADQQRDASPQQRLEWFFSDATLAALHELRDLARADGVQVIIVADGSASAQYPEPISDPTYERGQRQFFDTMANVVNARVLYDLDTFSLPQYAITDTIHRNSYGARLFTARAAASYLNDPALLSQESILPAAPLPSGPSTDPTLTPFAALIETPGRADARLLRLSYLQNGSVPTLPASGNSVAAKLADGSEVVLPAQPIAAGAFQVDFGSAGIDLARHQILYVRPAVQSGGRLVALNQPLAAYTWLPEPAG